MLQGGCANVPGKWARSACLQRHSRYRVFFNPVGRGDCLFATLAFFAASQMNRRKSCKDIRTMIKRHAQLLLQSHAPVVNGASLRAQIQQLGINERQFVQQLTSRSPRWGNTLDVFIAADLWQVRLQLVNVEKPRHTVLANAGTTGPLHRIGYSHQHFFALSRQGSDSSLSSALSRRQRHSGEVVAAGTGAGLCSWSLLLSSLRVLGTMSLAAVAVSWMLNTQRPFDLVGEGESDQAKHVLRNAQDVASMTARHVREHLARRARGATVAVVRTVLRGDDRPHLERALEETRSALWAVARFSFIEYRSCPASPWDGSGCERVSNYTGGHSLNTSRLGQTSPKSSISSNMGYTPGSLGTSRAVSVASTRSSIVARWDTLQTPWALPETRFFPASLPVFRASLAQMSISGADYHTAEDMESVDSVDSVELRFAGQPVSYLPGSWVQGGAPKQPFPFAAAAMGPGPFGKSNAVLIFHGSFAPFHLGHRSALATAVRFLLDHSVCLKKAVIACTTEKQLARKVPGCEFVKEELRCLSLDSFVACSGFGLQWIGGSWMVVTPTCSSCKSVCQFSPPMIVISPTQPWCEDESADSQELFELVHGAGKFQKVQHDAVSNSAYDMLIADFKLSGHTTLEPKLVRHVLDHDKKCTLACFQSQSRDQRLRALAAGLKRMGLPEKVLLVAGRAPATSDSATAHTRTRADAPAFSADMAVDSSSADPPPELRPTNAQSD
eukprot:1249602-Amphidinium_carterae.1